MNKLHPLGSSPRNDFGQSRWLRLLVAGSVIFLFLALLSRRTRDQPETGSDSTASPGEVTPADSADLKAWRKPTRRSAFTTAPAPTAEEIVASKVREFGRSRRELVRAIARRSQKEIPPEVEAFFDAIESGYWPEIERLGKALGKRSGQYEGSTHWEELNPFWPAVLDAYGVAEQSHLWPSQKLLDYGNAILDSLRPGMVYVGGTDPGRWIPELLNETSGAEQHIIVTQNAFADGRYLDFMQNLYGERFSTLTQEDSKRAFDEYVADARKRFEHDQQFPDEPRQVRPGEKVWTEDGKFQVTGQVSVMTINEKLLHMLMEKNPDLSFAMEESFPFKSMFGSATPLGPIMELGVQDEQNALTGERASQAVDYWRTAAQQLLSDPEAAGSRDVLLSYSKLVSSQAGLLRERGYVAEAEQAFRIANEIAPTSPEAVFRYVSLLVEQGRYQDAMPIAQTAVNIEPENQQFRNLMEELKRLNRK
jgi:tetratricopeptide (TPR) repeat protein